MRIRSKQTTNLFPSPVKVYTPKDLREAIEKQDLELCRKLLASNLNVNSYIMISQLRESAYEKPALLVVLANLHGYVAQPALMTDESIAFFTRLIPLMLDLGADVDLPARYVNVVSDMVRHMEESCRTLAETMLPVMRVFSPSHSNHLGAALQGVISAMKKEAIDTCVYVRIQDWH